MSRAQFEAMKKKRGSVSAIANTRAVQNLTPDQIRQEAFKNRGGSASSPAQMTQAEERRQELLTKWGYDFVHIDELEPHPLNDYSIEPESIENLAASIYESGNLEALLVRTIPEQHKLQILAGERRWHAIRLLAERYGEAWAMAPIRNMGIMSDEDALFVLHSDNLAQRTLSPSERAKGFSVIADRITRQRETDEGFKSRYKGKKTREILAEQFGVSESSIAMELAISRQLKDEGKELLDEGELKKHQAASIARLPEDKQDLIIEYIQQGNTDTRDIDEAIKTIKSGEASKDSFSAGSVKKAKTQNSLLKNASRSLKKAVQMESSENIDFVTLAQIKKYVMELDKRANKTLDSNTL